MAVAGRGDFRGACYTLGMKSRSLTSPYPRREKTKAPFALGLSAYEHMSAIEGIVLSPESKELIERLETSAMTADEKRAFILKRHQKTGI